MKKILYIIALMQITLIGFAQTKGIQYQAIIQDPAPYQIPGTFIQGQALQNTKVNIRFTIKTNKEIDFEEIHETQTDEFGLINLTIGKGKKSNGVNFDQIAWNGINKVLVVEVKINGQANYFEVSNQTLLYSPYALYADAVEYKNINNAPKDVSFFKNDAGYLVSNDLKPLEKKINDNQTENLNSFTLLKNQQITLETKVDEQGKKINETILLTQQLNARIDQQNAQINQNQSSIINQINGLSGSFESLGNKSTAIDLGNSNPSNQFYPSQRAVKTYVDQVISTVAVSGTPDATTLAAGKIQLSGDLGGTAGSPTVPGLILKENLSNKSLSIPTDGTSDTKYPSARAVKTYVDQATQGIALTADLNAKADKISPIFSGTPSLPTGTIGIRQGIGTNTDQLATTSFVQQELNAASINYSTKEDLSNKSSSTALGTSNSLYPTQNAVKVYVDNQIGSATISDASLSVKGKIRLGGDLASGSSTADDPIIRDNAITTNKVADLGITDAKIQSISGTKVTGNIAGESSNVTGTVTPAHGGTGLTTIPSNGVLIGNGTGNISTVVPTTSGQVLTWNGTAWTATVPTAVSAGTVGTSTANGLSISNNVISLSPADATNPGIITTGTQTFGGVKTFSGIKMATVSGTMDVSKGLFTDGSGNLTTSGTLAVAQGGTGNNTFTSGALLIGNGTGGITALAPGSNNGYILKVVGGQWAVGAAPSGGNQEASDQMLVTIDGQTQFTLITLPQSTSIASTSTFKMYVNGVRIDKNSYSVSNRTVTYDPANNGGYALKLNDRILFDYAY